MKDIKILLVDDDIDFVFIQKAFLEKEGFQVITAGDKFAGFERARAEKPDLAILDVMMTTDQEGFEMAREMRKDPQLKDIPIIMLTSVDSVMGLNLKEMANDPKWLPVDSYLEKPVQPQKLLDEIKRLLKL
ncbi:MAG TPA: response regulator [Bacteroidales bacterium]|jgi:DNA-binding response OmpR family regulator|nr:response regulator [Bacteroidales bacterium]MDI9574080.1 response regulator [Bacteroidota bacterium]OQC60564.1 MAG: Alkaline phosphatase synthesis transcriptional regulatory protein PhoP [Bacteroidetes bacterium ADurb.Bin012]MBP9511957.1 response regulator [Bacteroidales bacterium]MBP9588676.1 response regulator [Bacteroidales bacterium]